MHRDLDKLSSTTFDVVIIGGGIYGACTAWEAASRGLSVALLEKADFGSATSANSLKIIHGGFRYLQHADLARMRESIKERQSLMYIAPHLVHPMPVLLPTYGYGLKSREVFTAALMMNEIISYDRNRLSDPQKFIPKGSVLSRGEILDKIPGLPLDGLRGGVLFYDAQVHNSERLVLAFLLSAAKAGAQVANYAEVTGFIQNQEGVLGVYVTDRLSREIFPVRSRMVINMAGPWVGEVNRHLAYDIRRHTPALSSAYNVITRPLFGNYAVGLQGKNNLKDENALIDKGSSFLFAAPWRGHSLIGTTYAPYAGSPEDFKPQVSQVQILLDQFNQAYPPANLTLEDVTFVHAGLLPADRAEGSTVNLTRHYKIYDHRQDGFTGLLTVLGVKYTTARDVAEKSIDRLYEIWGHHPPHTVSRHTRLFGGQIERMDEYVRQESERRICDLEPEQIQQLVSNYGSAYEDVLRYYDEAQVKAGQMEPSQALVKAQVIHAIRHEMAYTLMDVLLRRTGLGTAAYPGNTVLELAGEVMASELGWSDERLREEREEIHEIYSVTGRAAEQPARLADPALQ